MASSSAEAAGQACLIEGSSPIPCQASGGFGIGNRAGEKFKQERAEGIDIGWRG